MAFVSNPAVLKDGVTAGLKHVTTSKAAQSPTPSPTTKTTDVYFWYFEKAEETESATPAYSQSMLRTRDKLVGSESVVNTIDGRKKVAAADYSTPDGKYRAIVKLFLLYEGQLANGVTPKEAAWAIATGWLVSGDIVVTAGHCAFDYSHSYGRLIKAKAYVGYGSNMVAFRYGIGVVTTDGWINNEGSEPSDFSLIKLSSEFGPSDVNSFYEFTTTPLWGKNVELGVVGYPGDIVNEEGERGAEMYEMFRSTNYDLASSKDHMLQYQIDTYGGNSGSPVFGSQVKKDGKNLVFGVHVLGGYSSNSASVFGGDWGNRAQAHKDTVSKLNNKKEDPEGSTKPDVAKRSWLRKYSIESTEIGTAEMKEQLKDTITAAQTVTADIPKNVLDWNMPLSYGGDAGPQMAILSSAAISVAGRLAADSVNGRNAELLGNTRPYDGVLGRAILAEAAMEYFFDLTAKEQEAHHEMLGPIVAALKPVVMAIAPRILKGVLEPSMRLLLSTKVEEGKPKRKRAQRSTEAEIDTGFGYKLSEKEGLFLAELMDEVKKDTDAVEGFFTTLSTVGDILGGALKKAGPLLKDVAKIGLPLLLGTESGIVQSPALDPLAQRAMLAEACLQTFIGLDGEARKKIYPTIVKVIKKFGPALARAVPYVGKHVAPVVADILRDVSAKHKQEFLDFTWGNKQEFLDFTWGNTVSQ